MRRRQAIDLHAVAPAEQRRNIPTGRAGGLGDEQKIGVFEPRRGREWFPRLSLGDDTATVSFWRRDGDRPGLHCSAPLD